MPHYTSGLRILALAGLTLILIAAVPAEARAASCYATLKWRGTMYYGGVRVPAADFGARVGTGIQPRCGLPGDPQSTPPVRLEIRRISGVLPALAVGVRQGRTAYLAEGYVIDSPRHPLNRFRRANPSATRGWSCGAAFRRTGRVTDPPPNLVDPLRIGRARYVIDAETFFSSRVTRHGVPYLPRGMRVGLTAVRCTASGGRSKLVARSFWSVSGSALAG